MFSLCFSAFLGACAIFPFFRPLTLTLPPRDFFFTIKTVFHPWDLLLPHLCVFTQSVRNFDLLCFFLLLFCLFSHNFFFHFFAFCFSGFNNIFLCVWVCTLRAVNCNITIRCSALGRCSQAGCLFLTLFRVFFFSVDWKCFHFNDKVYFFFCSRYLQSVRARDSSRIILACLCVFVSASWLSSHPRKTEATPDVFLTIILGVRLTPFQVFREKEMAGFLRTRGKFKTITRWQVGAKFVSKQRTSRSSIQGSFDCWLAKRQWSRLEKVDVDRWLRLLLVVALKLILMT